MPRKIIVLAAHDDGSGAHVVMAHLCRALLRVAKEKHENPLIVYLNKSSYNLDFAKERWFASSEAERWTRSDDPEEFPDDKRMKDKDGVWLCAENILKFRKAPGGALDVSGTRAMLAQFQKGFKGWAGQLRKIHPKRVAVAIEMGVPQLSHWAWKRNIPAVSIGDMFWSRSLRESLEGAGEYDEQAGAFIHRIAEYERCAGEVWLLPLVAARDYLKFFSENRIPANILPGFIGPRPAKDEIKRMEQALKLESRKLVALAGGTTPVWNSIYKKLGALVRKKIHKEFALIHPQPNGQPLVLIDNGRTKHLPQSTAMLPLFARADLGITRGGITITEFIAAGLPFVVVQEPDHWLSRVQQAQVRDAGLCHSTCLSRLTNEDTALDLIKKCLASPKNAAMKARMSAFHFGVEDEWAQYILKRYVRAGGK